MGPIEKELQGLVNRTYPYGWSPHLFTDIVECVSRFESAPLSSFLESRLDNPDALKEEVIVYLIMQTQIAEVDPVTLSSRVFKRLTDRLLNQDVMFLIHAMLSDHIPLPRSLVYDVTERLILDLEVIYRKVVKDFRSVSNRNTAKVILYLTFHYCRRDINTQNKEMIALILAHIQAAVPSEIIGDAKVFLNTTFLKEIKSGAGEESIGSIDDFLFEKFQVQRPVTRHEAGTGEGQRENESDTPHGPVISESSNPAEVSKRPHLTDLGGRERTVDPVENRARTDQHFYTVSRREPSDETGKTGEVTIPEIRRNDSVRPADRSHILPAERPGTGNSHNTDYVFKDYTGTTDNSGGASDAPGR